MLLIDTSNVLHVTGVLPSHLAGLDVPGLARLIAASRYARRRAVLVCDGLGPRPGAEGARPGADAMASTNTAPSGREVAGLDVVYAGANQEADDVIERLIAHDSAPRRLLVVSTDRRLVRAARRRRAQSIASEAFLRHLASDSDKPKAQALPGFAAQVPLNEYAVDYWMAHFGYGQAKGVDAPGEGPISNISKAAQRGLEQLRLRERARQLAQSPNAHERLKIPQHLLEADGACTPTATKPAPPSIAPALHPPAPPKGPVPAGELPSDLARLLKDSGLRIDPAELDMSRWLPRDEPPASP